MFGCLERFFGVLLLMPYGLLDTFFVWGVTRHDHLENPRFKKSNKQNEVYNYAIKDCHNEVSVLCFLLCLCFVACKNGSSLWLNTLPLPQLARCRCCSGFHSPHQGDRSRCRGVV